MSIAAELEAYATSPGLKCRFADLLPDHPAEYGDLLEALASSAQHSAVARWWNATRTTEIVPEISANMVARHRAKECLRCR